ncbi:MAG: hypothetical protein IJL63_02515 [Clostridia bacterium]|nr:hypothetical protein [Clostridia bacterium]
MDFSNNSTKAFTDAIKKMAAEECKKIDDETRLIKKQRFNFEKEQAKDKYKDYIDYELVRIETEKNKKLSLEAEKSKKELAELRSELCEKVLCRAGEEIKNFTESAQYADFLINSANEAISALGEESAVLYARPEDIDLLSGKGFKAVADSTIKLGGVKAVEEKSGCLADNTLDLKLASQREWLLENSDLKI